MTGKANWEYLYLLNILLMYGIAEEIYRLFSAKYCTIPYPYKEKILYGKVMKFITRTH